jgi:hypothetical protein
MAQVKKRIADLERQVSQEEKRSNDIEVEKARKEINMLRVRLCILLFYYDIS